MSNDNRISAERSRLLETEKLIPTSRFGRLWRTGRSAGALVTATLGNRLRGKSGGLGAADVADIVKLVERLGELKGVAMKVGQIMSYIDPSLPPELRGLLSLLQTAAPASPFSAIESTLREAFGDRADVLLRGLEREPLAVASIGQVHKATVDGLQVAVKIRHPGILEALKSDFATAAIGPFVARAFGAIGDSVKETVEEAKTAMFEECDFALEATRQTMFREWYKDHPTLSIPKVVSEWSTESVLTTRFSAGQSLDVFLAQDPSQSVKNRVGIALFELYFGTLYRRGFFHADPHPGNYAFGEKGEVIVYDFGCVRSFDVATVQAFAKLSSAVRADNMAEMASAFKELGALPPKDDEGRENMRTLLRGFFGPLLEPGIHRITKGAGFDGSHIFEDKRALAKFALPGKLLFLFRIRFGLYAVLQRLGAEADWAALESEWAAAALGQAAKVGVANTKAVRLSA